MKELKIEYLPVSDLKFYEKNAKKHPDKQVSQIARSIEVAGFVVPVLVNKNKVLVAGHGRIMAAKKLGIEKVPTVCLDGLTDDQIRFLRLADNKLAESGYDNDLVLAELEELELAGYDVSDTGFEIDKLEDDRVDGDVDFTTELMEENNYVVFAFNNSLDWNVVQENLGLIPVQSSDSKKGYRRVGVGRVVTGDVLLELIEMNNL